MERRTRLYVFLTLAVTLGLGGVQQAVAQAVLDQPEVETKTLPERTALDDYVQKKDDTFSWKVVSSETSGDMQTFVLTMNSQTWRTEEEVDRPVWQHWISIAVPVAEPTVANLPRGPTRELRKSQKRPKPWSHRFT